MTERKPISETWESFAERKIREAQEEGLFQSLPGFGQPIPGIDQPPDENWWLKQKLKAEQLSVLPPVLEARLDAERTLDSLAELPTESAVRRRLEQLNERIRKAHFAITPGPSAGVLPVDIDAAVEQWRQTRSR